MSKKKTNYFFVVGGAGTVGGSLKNIAKNIIPKVPTNKNV
jgi:hypothetical protein